MIYQALQIKVGTETKYTVVRVKDFKMSWMKWNTLKMAKKAADMMNSNYK